MIKQEDLQGSYEISYQSTPPLEDWYEPGFGSAQIQGNTLTGIDGSGVEWKAELKIQADGTIAFDAVLNADKAPEGSGLMDKNGNMTRDKQYYQDVLKPTKVGNLLILRTTVVRGPLTINVQFKKI